MARWDVPKGGFYIWLRLNGKVPVDRLFQEALKHGILFNPGNIYDYAENRAIRLSYAYAEPEEVDRALEILASLVDKSSNP